MAISGGSLASLKSTASKCHPARETAYALCPRPRRNSYFNGTAPDGALISSKSQSAQPKNKAGPVRKHRPRPPTNQNQLLKMKPITVIEIREVSESQWDCTIEVDGKRLKISRLHQYNRPSATHLAEYYDQHPASFQAA